MGLKESHWSGQCVCGGVAMEQEDKEEDEHSPWVLEMPNLKLVARW